MWFNSISNKVSACEVSTMGNIGLHAVIYYLLIRGGPE